MPKSNFFYGWFMLACMMLMYSVNATTTNVVPLFLPEVAKEFKWEHKVVAAPASLYYFIIALLAPLAGYVVGRFSTKYIMAFGTLLGIIGYALYFNIHAIWQLYVAYILLSASMVFSGIIPGFYIISKWFVRYRGIALGLFLMGSSLGGFIFPQLCKIYIPMYGWRTTLMLLMCLMAIVGLLPIYFIKNLPSEKNQLPDGDTMMHEQNEKNDTQQTTGLSFSQVLKTPAFYLLCFVTGSFWWCGFSLITHGRFYFQDQGLGLNVATNVFSLFYIFGIAGKLIFGFLSDKFEKVNILIVATVSLTIGILVLQSVPITKENGAYAYAILFGAGYAGAFMMIQLTVADLFGGKAFANTLGIVTTVDSIAGGLGVYLLGKMRTTDQSYNNGILLLLILSLVAIVFSVLLKYFHPTKRKEKFQLHQ